MRDAPESGRERVTARASVSLGDDQVAAIARAAFNGLGSAMLAVSGGADSMTLMLITERWRAIGGAAALNFPVHVATVDHGLRAGSAAEATWVGQRAAAIGLPHHSLAWVGAKPTSGIQEAAREARYALLAGLIGRLGLPQPAGIVLGHHLDDQAETFLMRLARGSGIDGLAGMQARRDVSIAGVRAVLVRPLLGLPKARLEATLAEAGRDWLEDPSNTDQGFERVRVRRALAGLDAAGVAPAMIATSVGRIARAVAALEAMTDDLQRRALKLHDGAYAEIDAAAFGAAPAELRLRLLQRVVRWFGGGGHALPKLQRLEALEQRLAVEEHAAATLGGCLLLREPTRILAMREPGRRGLPEIVLAPGEARNWDNRFLVASSRPVQVKALPAETLTALLLQRKKAGLPPLALPRRAALTLPSFWHAGRLIGLPHPAFGVGTDIGISAHFIAQLPPALQI